MLRGGRITASAGKPGVWRAILIEAGRSANGHVYPADMLRARAAEGIFEGRPGMCFAAVDAGGAALREHVGPVDLVGRTPLNTAVCYRNTRWDESLQAVVGDMHILLGTPTGDELEAHLRALESQSACETFGLSIDGEGPSDAQGNVDLRLINSVDVVTRPAAGGRVLHRIAASRGFGGSPVKTLLDALKAKSARLAEGYTGPADVEWNLSRHVASRVKADAECAADLARLLGEKSPEESVRRWKEHTDALFIIDDCMRLLGGLRAEIVAAQAQATLVLGRTTEGQPTIVAPATPTGTTTPNAEDRKRIESLEKRVQEGAVAESRTRLTAACDAAKLPAKAKSALLLQHGARVLEAGEEQRLVESQRAVIDEAIQAQGGTVTIVRESHDRMTEALAHMFNPTQIAKPREGDQPFLWSFREFMERNVLGGRRMSEAMQGQGARRRLREAVDSTNFDQVFADALDRAVLAAYVGHANYRSWEKIVRKVPYADFRTHRVVNVGYYGTLPTVAKGAPYLAMTTPTDREQTIALAKKGGLESITFEDMLNDDLQLWQTTVQRIGQAAQETAFETVFALIRDATQPTMADGNTLTSSARSPVNEGTAVLSADATGKTNFINAVVGMMKGTGGSGQKKGVIPAHIVIPFEKVEAFAFVVQSLRGGVTGTDLPEAIQKVLGVATPEPIIDYGTGNAFDWYLLAKPNEAEVIRFGTLGGRDTPEVFIADDGRFGAMFTHDKIELKVRFIYAAAAIDFLGIYGNDAAS